MPAISVSACTMRNRPWLGLAQRSASSTTSARSRRVGLEPFPFVGVVGELHHHVGEQAGGRLAAGHLDLSDDRQHLGHTERATLHPVGRCQLGVEQIGQEVVAGIVPPVFDLGREVLLLLDDVELGGDALVVGDRPSDRSDRRIGPALELGLTGLGHLEDDRNGPHRQVRPRTSSGSRPAAHHRSRRPVRCRWCGSPVRAP